MPESPADPSRRHPLRQMVATLLHLRSHVTSQVRVLGLSILVGIVAGLGGIGFHIATVAVEHFCLERIVGYRPAPRPAGEHAPAWLVREVDRPFQPWLLLVVPTVGGILSGLIVFSFAPEAEGHGTDNVIAAYHQRQGYIRPRVPLVKIVASALTIGSGGSGGREGPIAQIGAGFGSMLSDSLRLRPIDRRVLMAAGMGAGIAAVFRAPLAGALFASEVLYRSPEFEPEVIMPAAIASVVSYCTFSFYAGWQPLFAIPYLSFHDVRQLLPYTLLMFWVVLLSLLYTHTFYGTVGLFHRVPLPKWLRPAVGAFFTGALGLGLYFSMGRDPLALSVLSFGYSSIQAVLNDPTKVSVMLLLCIAVGKIATTSLTIGSGGSGGVFGPSMVIGGCGGGALGILMHQWWPAIVPHPAAYVLVGMAGFFAAAAKTPFSTMIIVSEMTGGYDLLLPSLWVCVLAFIVSGQSSIYISQVRSRSRSPAHQGDYVREVLADIRVKRFIGPGSTVLSVTLGDPLPKVIDRLAEAPHPVLPVVDDQGRFLGVVDLEEVHLVSRAPYVSPLVVAEDLMRGDVEPLQPEDSLDRALELFVENDLMALPIVDNPADRRLLGMVRRFDIAREYLRFVHAPRSEPGLAEKRAAAHS
ncbi:MAG: chloride channel protein [Planctomycetota bacterium]